MNYDRMRVLAGLPVVEPKAVVIETVEDESIEVVEDGTVAISTKGDVTITSDVVVEGEVAAEEVVVETEDKAPELDPKAEKGSKKTKVPADVTAAINQRIAELKASIAEHNEKGYNDGGVKPNAIEALEQIAADLKLEDGLTVANVFYGTLSSPITDLFPPKVVKFLHSKG